MPPKYYNLSHQVLVAVAFGNCFTSYTYNQIQKHLFTKILDYSVSFLNSGTLSVLYKTHQIQKQYSKKDIIDIYRLIKYFKSIRNHLYLENSDVINNFEADNLIQQLIAQEQKSKIFTEKDIDQIYLTEYIKNKNQSILPYLHQSWQVQKINSEEAIDLSNLNSNDNYSPQVILTPQYIEQINQKNNINEIKIGTLNSTYKIKRAYRHLTQCNENESKQNQLINLFDVFDSNEKYYEEMLFPHLFPLGHGGFNSTFKGIITFTQYIRLQLYQNSRQKAQNINYVVQLNERLKRHKILKWQLFQQSPVGYLHNLQKLNARYIKDKSVSIYNSLNNYIPTDIENSHYYWKNRFQDLQSLMQKFGPADLFITLTQNDNDPGLLHFLRINSNVENCTPQEDQVLASVYTRLKFDITVQYIKSLYGKTKAYFKRIEYQLRGASHLHLILWLEDTFEKQIIIEEKSVILKSIKNRLNDGTIVQVSLNNQDIYEENLYTQDQLQYQQQVSKKKYDQKQQILKTRQDYIKKFNIHNHNSKKCKFYQNSTTCSKGFPGKITEYDHLDINTGTWNYKRNLSEANVVPYCPMLLQMMFGHMNIQKISEKKLLMYLVKYTTKEEQKCKIVQKDKQKIPETNIDQVDVNIVDDYIKDNNFDDKFLKYR